MRWLFRLLVYFIKPLLIVWIISYFSWQTIKAVAVAITGYEKAKVTAEIKANLRAIELQKANQGNKEATR